MTFALMRFRSYPFDFRSMQVGFVKRFLVSHPLVDLKSRQWLHDNEIFIEREDLARPSDDGG